MASSSGLGVSDSVAAVVQFLSAQGMQELSDQLSRETAALLGGTDGGPDSVAPASCNPAADTSITEDVYEDEYDALLMLVERSADKLKPELSALLFPLFAHIYLQLLESSTENSASDARQFVQRYGPRQESIWNQDVDQLRRLTHTSQLQHCHTAVTLRRDKYQLRMARSTLAVLKAHMARHPLVERLIRQHLHIEATEGAPRSADAVLASAGSLLGEAHRSLNKVKMQYGVQREDFASVLDSAAAGDDEHLSKKKKTKHIKPEPKKTKATRLLLLQAQKAKESRESKKNKDPNAPAAARIPLPNWTETVKAEKREAQKEFGKRIRLTAGGSSSSGPSACLFTVLNGEHGVSSCCLSENGQMLSLGYENSNVQVWSVDAQSPLKSLKKSSDLQNLDIDAPDLRQQLLDTDAGQQQQQHTLVAHSGTVYATCFSPDRRLLLSASHDATVRLWSTQVWKNVVVYRTAGQQPVFDVDFCARGFYFASASADHTAAVWATDRLQPVRLFTQHTGQVGVGENGCVRFHPNCNYVATASDDRVVRVWDMATGGACVRYLTGHKDVPTCCAFSPDGRLLAAGAVDGQLCVWDLAQGQLLANVSTAQPCYSLAFTRDSHVLAAGCSSAVHFVRVDQLTSTAGGGSAASGSSQSASGGQPIRTEMDALSLGHFGTKHTPVLAMQFTARNLLLAAGPYNQL